MFSSRDKIKVIGIILGAVWLLLLLLFWWLTPDGEEKAMRGAVRVMIVIGATMPLFVIWLAVAMADAVARLNEDADNLRMRLSQLREQTPPPNPQPVREAAIQPPMRNGAPRSGPAPRPNPAAQQATMQFEAPEPVEITPTTLILALNFPNDAEDHEAIAAMRTALRDRDLARVLRAAQDVITLLAKYDIFMDDLAASPAEATTWRHFTAGERGETITAIGDIGDKSVLEHISALLRSDEIFRDSAHHFLRHFDRMLARRAAQLDDGQLGVLVETRSARAFTLLGKAAGIFG